MSNILTTVMQAPPEIFSRPGREAATYAWQLWIKSATGEEANIVRKSDKNVLVWKPGQANKMSNYFSQMLTPDLGKKDEPTERGLGFSEVSIDWKPVYTPIILKKIVPVVALYTLAAFGAGYLIAKKRKKR